MPRDSLLLLEDDPDRLVRFRAVAPARFPRLRLVEWRSAVRMLADLPAMLPTARVVCLDHDLVADPGEPDPGDGLDVARWLAEQPPACPVVIHTSNTRRGDAMEGELDLAGWTYTRVLPVGDDWIEVDWVAAVRRVTARRRG